MFQHAHMSPMLSCASIFSTGYLYVILGCRGTHMFGHPLGEWMPPMCPTTPCIICSPVSVRSRGSLHVLCRNCPYIGGLGASAHLSGFWCLSLHPLDVHYASSCTSLVVHYVSSLYHHGYNYYFSSDSGVFWYATSIISDCGSLFDGASYNVGSA